MALMFSHSASSGIADLELEVNFNESDSTVFQRTGEFSIRVTNLGPDIAGIDGITPFPIAVLASVIEDNGFSTPEIQFIASSNNDNTRCFFSLLIGDPRPGDPVLYAYDINLPILEVNETIECFGIFSTHFSSGTREVTWSMRNTFDTDPVAENNEQTVIFGIQPRSVPTNNSLLLLLLVFTILLFSRKSFH